VPTAPTPLGFTESLTITPASSPSLTWGALAASAFDYDRDDDLDLVVPGGFAFWIAKPAGLSLLRNDGRGHFEDLGEASGLNTPRVYSNVYAFDYDNDGDLDLYATALESSTYYDGKYDEGPSGNGFDVLYRNDGGRFQDVTAEAGIAENGNTWGAAVADIDNDGWLDLYVAEYVDADLLDVANEFTQGGPVEKDLLYRNRGDGTFAEESAQRGLGTANPHDRIGYTPMFHDYDGDGDQDLLVPQDFGRLMLALNDGSGHFSDGNGRLRGPGVGTWMGCAAFDFDGDGDFDFTCDNGGTAVLTNALVRDTWPKSGTPYQVLLQNDRGVLTDVAAEVPLENLPPPIESAPFSPPKNFQRMPWGWGISVADVDNDGREDLYQTGSFAVLQDLVVGYADQGAHAGALLQRTQDGFRHVTVETGLSNARADGYLLPSWGNLLVDLSGDGALDVVICNHTTSWMTGGLRIFQNSGHGNHWVAFALRGTSSNRDGVGAVVRLYAGGTPQLRAITVGGWGGAPLPARFGLGETTVVERVEIEWPSGKRQTIARPPIDRIVSVNEP
jgi:hypothetical protein